MTEKDPINPDYYKTEGGLEAIEVIEAFFAEDAHLAAAFKYLARLGKKSTETPAKDIRKSIWYLERKRDILDDQSVPEGSEESDDNEEFASKRAEAIAQLHEAGITTPPYTSLVYAEMPGGARRYLNSSGEWERAGFGNLTTSEIIKLLKDKQLCDGVDLVGSVGVDDGLSTGDDAVSMIYFPRAGDRLKDALGTVWTRRTEGWYPDKALDDICEKLPHDLGPYRKVHYWEDEIV